MNMNDLIDTKSEKGKSLQKTVNSLSTHLTDNRNDKEKESLFSHSEFLEAFKISSGSCESRSIACTENLKDIKAFEQTLTSALSELKSVTNEQGIKFSEIQKVKKDNRDENYKFQKSYLAQKGNNAAIINVYGINNVMGLVFYSLQDKYVKENYVVSENILDNNPLKELPESK